MLTAALEFSGTETYTYSITGQLTEDHKPTGEKITYTFDMAGNKVGESAIVNGTTKMTTFSYDEAGRMVTVEADALMTTYDAAGARIKQEVASNVTRFLVDTSGMSQVVADINSGGNLTTFYARGQDLLGQRDAISGDWYYHLMDGHGSTSILLQPDGTQTDWYRYDSWGNTRASSGSTTRFRYTGQEQDDTNLYYLRARYYSPWSGRFMARDPWTGSPQDPQSLHRYAYCANDPVNCIDPTGAVTMANVMVTSAIMGGLFGGVSGYIQDGWRGAFYGAIIGAASGLLMAVAGIGFGVLTTALGITSTVGVGLTLFNVLAAVIFLPLGIRDYCRARTQEEKWLAAISVALSVSAAVGGAGSLRGRVALPGRRITLRDFHTGTGRAWERSLTLMREGKIKSRQTHGRTGEALKALNSQGVFTEVTVDPATGRVINTGVNYSPKGCIRFDVVASGKNPPQHVRDFVYARDFSQPYKNASQMAKYNDVLKRFGAPARECDVLRPELVEPAPPWWKLYF